MFYFLFLISLIYFFVSYLIYKRTSWTTVLKGGFFLNLLFSFYLVLVLFVVRFEIWLLRIIVIIITFTSIITPGLLMFILTIYLFFNGYTMIKKERISLRNLLGFFLASFLTAYTIYGMFFEKYLPKTIHIFLSPLPSLFFILGVMAAFYLITLFLYLRYHGKKQKNVDVIIVLGCGLINGEKVSPLLKSRIDKGIELLEKQETDAKIIFSGGQGNDELISEAEAMSRYALENNVPKEKILLEDQSQTTFENFLYSKKMIETLPEDKRTIVFVSNNYHILRAAIYAKKAGLDAVGIGSKTAYYFLPSALIREIIAFIVMKKRPLIILTLICFSFSTLLALLNAILNIG